MSTIERLRLIKEQPEFYQALSDEELVDLLLYLIEQTEHLEENAENLSREEQVALIRELVEAIPKPKPGRPGKDAKITDELVNSIIDRVRSKIEIPELPSVDDLLNEVLAKVPEPIKLVADDIRDILSDGEQLPKESIEGLDEIENNLEATVARLADLDNINTELNQLRNVVGTSKQVIRSTVLKMADDGEIATSDGGHTIQDEGTPLTQRTNLNFVGAGVTVTDDSGNDATVVTISGGGGGGFTQEEIEDFVGALIQDSAEIDFTYNDATPSITASLVTGSIDVLKLDAGVQASLALADSAIQSGANISVFNNDAGYITATLSQEQVEDFVGAMVSGNTETLITVTYQDVDGTLDFVVDNDLANYSNANSQFLTDITGEAIGDLSDVTITTLADGELLMSASGSWINRTLAEAGIQAVLTEGAFVDGDKTKLDGIESGAEVNNISDANATDLTDGGDTTLHIHDGRYYTETELDAGQLDNRYYTESEINAFGYISDITGENLTDLADVVITTPADNEVLAFDTGSGNFINQTPAEAGLAEASHTHTKADLTDIADFLLESEVDADIKTLALPANTTISTFGASLIDDATAGDARTTLGLVIGTDVQAYDTGLASIAGLTTLADRMIYTTASDTYAVSPLTSFARTILDDASASDARTTLGVVIGTDVARVVDYQEFTANGTWTKPANAKAVMIFAIGGGGGGGKGKAGAEGTLRPGGGGGGPGGVGFAFVPASSLSSSESVTVGAGGTAGTVDGAFNSGGNGGNTSFGSVITGGGGGGGFSGSGFLGAVGGQPGASSFKVDIGGDSVDVGGFVTPGLAGHVGSGAGGALRTAANAYVQAVLGGNGSGGAGGAGGGTTLLAAGSAGGNGTYTSGGGGGGGGGPRGVGGDGGANGGGGGGGGCAISPATGGNGGAGGAGRLIAVSFG